jgi:hypothetical protein
MSVSAQKWSKLRLRSLLAAGVATLALSLAHRVSGGPQDEVKRRDYAIAGFKPPPRWDLLPRDRPSYPQLLAWASRGQGAARAVITLIGKRLDTGTTLQQFAQEANGLGNYPAITGSRIQLQSASGWWGGQRAQVDATLNTGGSEHRAQVLRQLMFLNPPFGYVLTLVAPQEQAQARYRDLDDTASNLTPLPIASATMDAAVLADGGQAPP